MAEPSPGTILLVLMHQENAAAEHSHDSDEPRVVSLVKQQAGNVNDYGKVKF